MSLVASYFGKDSDKLSYGDFETFFSTEHEESNTLEFKSYVALGDDKEKEKGIFKAICAFLNSGGGVLVWGAPIGQKLEGRKEKVFVGQLTPQSRRIEKDSFINRITDAISPAPNDILFHSFEKDGQFIYVIEARQSEYSPHQYDHIYYMRIDGQSRPAPHYFVEALFKKITFPLLAGHLKLESYKFVSGKIHLGVSFIVFNESRLQNAEELFVRVVIGHAGIFFESGIRNGSSYGMGGHEMIRREQGVTYYNQPQRYKEMLAIDPHELSRKQNALNIWMFFGSRTTPLLLSRYDLKIDPTNAEVKDLNTLIGPMQENKFWFEHEDSLGLSDAVRKKEMLGR